MPDGYDWQSQAISESAAQGLRHAWIARLGFVLFGTAVLWVAWLRRSVWPRVSSWLHVAFGLFMFGAAAFSHRPWLEVAPVDELEDLLHSVAATGMGFAFAFGVLIRLLRLGPGRLGAKSLDIVALLAAVALTPLGGVYPDIAGLLQRVMFVVAYAWYGWEAIRELG